MTRDLILKEGFKGNKFIYLYNRKNVLQAIRIKKKKLI